MISEYETQYIQILTDILKKGYHDNNRTGMLTLKLPHKIMTIDLEKEFPILKSKKVAFKTAVKEMLWIMQKQSNNIHDLDGHIWDEWADATGSIGKAYGYQIKKFNQIDNLIKSLKEDPQDRRMMLNMWNWEDLSEMNLAPCCFLSMWDVTDERLNCMLIQRSGDFPLGVPFNTTQYAVLTHLIAQSVGLKAGLLTHVINNAHVYDNQQEGVEQQLLNASKLRGVTLLNEDDGFTVDGFPSMLSIVGAGKIKHAYNLTDEELPKITSIYNSSPKLVLNENIHNFYDFTIDDINLEDYTYFEKIKMPVSV